MDSLIRKRRFKYMEMLEMVSYCEHITDHLLKLKKKMPDYDFSVFLEFEQKIDAIRQNIIRKELDLIAGMN